MITGPDGEADALDQLHWTRRHTFLSFALLLVFFFNTYCTELFALTVPAITAAWQVSAKQLAVAMAMGWLGSGVGSFLGGVTGDRIGRYRSVVVASGIAALATLASSLVTGPAGMTVMRAVAGLALGATIPPALALIAECTPRRMRGIVISLAMICSPLGMSACAAIAAVMLPHHSWRTVFVLGGVLTLAITILFALTAVESPRFLLQRPSRRPELDRALRRLGIAPEAANAAAPQVITRGSTAAAVLSPEYRGLTLRTWLCFAAVFISVTALTSWVPTGLAQAGFATSLASGAISAWSFGGVGGTLLSGWCLMRWGARLSTQGFALGSALSMLLLVLLVQGPGGSDLAVIVPMALSGFMMSAMITTIFALATEVYPAPIRSTGVGMAAMLGRSTAVLGSYGGIYALDVIGMRGYFVVLGAICLVPVLMLWAGTAARRVTQTAPAVAVDIGMDR